MDESFMHFLIASGFPWNRNQAPVEPLTKEEIDSFLKNLERVKQIIEQKKKEEE